MSDTRITRAVAVPQVTWFAAPRCHGDNVLLGEDYVMMNEI